MLFNSFAFMCLTKVIASSKKRQLNYCPRFFMLFFLLHARFSRWNILISETVYWSPIIFWYFRQRTGMLEYSDIWSNVLGYSDIWAHILECWNILIHGTTYWNAELVYWSAGILSWNGFSCLLCHHIQNDSGELSRVKDGFGVYMTAHLLSWRG